MVNAPLIWIIIPGILSVLLLFLLRFRRIVTIVGMVISILLALLVIFLPIGKPIVFGPLSFEVSETMVILGRSFILDSSKYSVVVLLYLGTAFWFGGTIVEEIDRKIIPAGLGLAALLTAALIVQPFLYAAIFIEIAVLICVAVLVTPQHPVPRGALRFLTFQTLALPFILMVGWMLSGIEANPGDAILVRRVAVMAALGFGLLLAIFPFHSWIPMLAEEAHPYIVAFVFYTYSLAISLFVIHFLQRYNWLYLSPWLLVFLRLSGVIMVVLAGIASAFQRHLGRLMGFAMLVEIGYSLLAMSLAVGVGENRVNFGILFASFLPRGLGLGLIALALVIFGFKANSLEFDQIRGLGRDYLLATAGLFLGLLTIVGFPLTAGFPLRLTLWQALGLQFPLAAYAAIIGSFGILSGGLRAIAVLVVGSGREPWNFLETVGQRILFSISIALIVFIGLVPQGIYPVLFRMANIFLNIGP
jgi:NADH-quinone oxidoreductase subunit N